jgi:uncharacterized protein (TIGR02996 family)
MVREEAFLATLKADPADAVTRSVYADWLEERGDVRGEYIRVEERMAALPPACDEHAALKVRKKELRPGIEGEWLKAMGYVPRHRPLFTKLPERRVERWRLVEEFIDTWHRPLTAGDGCTEEEIAEAERRLGARLPAALREWHALAGRRKDVWSVQDHLLRLHQTLWFRQLHFDQRSDALVIRSENQGCEHWGIRPADLDLDDPPIWELGAGRVCSPTLSAFACQTLLYEAKFSDGVIWAGEIFPPDEAAVLRPLFTPCALPDQYWVAAPLAFLEGADLIIELHGDWVYIAARNEEAFARVPEAIRSQLEVYHRPA